MLRLEGVVTTDIHSVMEAIRGHVADGDASEANRCAIGHPLAIEYLRQHGVPVVESVKSYRGQDILFNRHSVSGIESRFIGNAVLEVRVGPVQDELVFVTDSGPVALRTDADCCSETWFADIVGVRWLLGERVTDIQQIPMTDAHTPGVRPRLRSAAPYPARRL